MRMLRILWKLRLIIPVIYLLRICSFLCWLEGKIGTPVEELTNKTPLKDYNAHGFDAFAIFTEAWQVQT